MVGVVVPGLLRTAVWVALFGVTFFDAAGLFVNRVQLDEAAAVAAVEAAQSWRRSAKMDHAWSAALDSVADQPGVEVLELRVDRGDFVLTVRRRARVILADRIPRLEESVDAVVSARAPIALRQH